MDTISRREALKIASRASVGSLPADVLARAAQIRDAHFGNRITYSPKVFIPLTKLCRDVCHYCTFARPPQGERVYMTIDEVVEVALAGASAGCREALFTLGDKPESRYKAAREELTSLGHSSTLGYLREAAEAVGLKTGLLPHLNPGLMTGEELTELRDVAPSMGLMLESISPRLMERGLPHHGSVDKDPARRLETIDLAGRMRIPFTTGMLIGIGETWEERVDTLLAIDELHRRHGHIQEVIVQNFRGKQGTPMASAPEPSLGDMLATIALARLVLSPDISVQAPPNLAWGDASLGQYIAAGINDWGGVSPLTPDHVNPEAPWPELDRLRDITESSGYLLLPRLTVYPRFATDARWISAKVRPLVLKVMDSEGMAREDRWHPGEAVDPPNVIDHPSFVRDSRRVKPRAAIERAIDRALTGGELDEDAIAELFGARGPELKLLFAAADLVRRETSGDAITYVVNRNINYTNMCYFRCGFCAFSKGPKSLNLRGDPYLLDLGEIAERAAEAAQRGATEVCLQGGIHPSFTGDFYVDVLRAIKSSVPDLHIHAFSPLEVWQGARTKGVSLADFLRELKDNGLGTLPGTAAEILEDRIRQVICPDKITTAEWSEVARTAHSLGLRMTTTIMFGHADDHVSWARHLLVLRDIQKETGGFTEFVPLPFVHMAAPIFLKGKARRGPTTEEAIKMHAVARLALNPLITNIQASWVKLGIEGAKMALRAGCNDLGGTLMNENISRAAGAAHGQELSVKDMSALAQELGRPLVRRTTLYGRVSEAIPA